MKFGENCNCDCLCDIEFISFCDMNMGECVCKFGFLGYICNCVVGLYSCNMIVFDCYYELN